MHQAEILKKSGKKQWEIAELLGGSDRMVRNYLQPKPETDQQPKHSLLDPYREYIKAQLEDALHYNLVVPRKKSVRWDMPGESMSGY